jgi:SAM-dependent methyltransferase
MIPRANEFAVSGPALRADLESPAWAGLFRTLEDSQAAFLAREPQFRSAEYRWPHDPLHTWSRVWEYPYVFANLRAWADRRPAGAAAPRVMDFGSGVTFFPFALAARNLHVTAVDTDPVAQRDFLRVARHVPAGPGGVDFILSSPAGIPAADASYDAVYSISVLEHVADPAAALAEIDRVLAPGGLLVLTFDLCLSGRGEISPARFQILKQRLADRFAWVHPAREADAAAWLRSGNGSYPSMSGRTVRDRLRRGARNAARRLLGRTPDVPAEYACIGAVLQKPGVAATRAEGNVHRVPFRRVPLAACPPVPYELHTGGQAASGTPMGGRSDATRCCP